MTYAGQRLDWGFIKFDIVDIDMVCQFALGVIDVIPGKGAGLILPKGGGIRSLLVGWKQEALPTNGATPPTHGKIRV